MSLGQTRKPDKIDLIIDGQYSTEKAEHVATNLKTLWEDEIGKNFNRIADHLEVSDGLVRKVYYEHFGEAGGEKTFEQEDEEIEEIIEKYREGELSVEPRQEYLDQELDDIPIEKYEGKTVMEIFGDPINPDLIKQALSEAYALGERNGSKEGFAEGVREGIKIEREKQGEG